MKKKMLKKSLKKSLSLFLSLLMIFTMIPATTLTSLASDYFLTFDIESEGPISETVDGITVTQYAEWINDNETKAKATLTIKTEPIYEDFYHDIIFIADVSSSINSERLAFEQNALKDAINEIKLSDQYVKNKIGIDDQSRVALISFSTEAQVECDFITDYNIYESAVDNLTTGGSTNYGAAFEKAQEIINNRTDKSREAAIIFVTDGAASHNFAQAQNIVTKLEKEQIFTYCVQYMFKYDYDDIFEKNYYAEELDKLDTPLISATRQALCNASVKNFELLSVFSEDHFNDVKFISATVGDVVIEDDNFITFTVSEVTWGEEIQLIFVLESLYSTDTFIPLCPFGVGVAYEGDNGRIETMFDKTFVLRQNHFTVTYDLNYGEGTVPVDSKIYNKNTSVIAAPPEKYNSYSSKFAGWNVTYTYEIAENGEIVTKSSDELLVVQPGETFKIKGNTILKAIWTRVDVYKGSIIKEPVYPVMKYYGFGTTPVDYHAYSSNVVSVTFLDEIDHDVVNNPDIPSWDVSANKDWSVVAWMIENENATKDATEAAGLTEPNDTTKRYDVYIGAKDGVAANPDSSCLFYDFVALETIYGLENLHTDNVTNMSNMFRGCINLMLLDLSTLNTENVTDMKHMFNLCRNLTSIKFGDKWNTKNVKYMDNMFRGCDKLTSLDLNNFNTSEVTNMAYMFQGCKNLLTLNVSEWNTSNVTDMNCMFFECSSLTNIDISKWNTKKVEYMFQMFGDCKQLTSLEIGENWDTSKVINMSYMFRNCSNLTKLDGNTFDTSNVTNMGYMFDGCSSLTELNLNSWKTDKVTNMFKMFSECKNLVTLSISNWNTEKLTNMSQMFYNCTNLASLEFGDKWSTRNVQDMAHLFYGCSSLTSLDVSNFYTSNINSMTSMFYKCSSLTELDLSEWDTSSVTNMSWMFRECSSLEKLNLSHFDVNKVTNMENMFYGCSKLKSLNLNWIGALNPSCHTKDAFRDCSALENINLSNWAFSDTVNITIPSAALTNVYLYNITENTDDVVYSKPLITNTDAAANVNIHTNIETTVFETMVARTSWLSNVDSDNIIYDEPVEVLGISSGAIEVKEKDYIWYFLSVRYNGQSGVYSDEISVSDKIPEGLTFVENYFSEEDYAEIGLPFDPDGTTFMIVPNMSISADKPQLTKNADEIFTEYPSYDANTNTVSFKVDGVPGGTFITVIFACQVDKLAKNENGKYFYNTAKYTKSNSDVFNSMQTIHYVLPTDDLDCCRVYYYYNGDIPNGLRTTNVTEGFKGDLMKVMEPPTVEGYTFSGWTGIDYDGNPVDISTGYFTLNNYVEFTGTWTKNPEPTKYTVTYEYTGTVPVGAPTLWSQSYETGKTVSVSDVPAISDYDFIGWISDDVKIKDDGTFIMPEKDVTFTGYYNPTKYTITYMLDGIEYKTEKATATSVITLEEPTISDSYAFLDWSSDDVSIIDGTSFIMPSNDITLYGYTEAANKFSNVTYKWKDNSYIPADIILTNSEEVIGSEYVLPVVENTDEYTFKGWTVIDSDGNEIAITDNTITIPESDITVIGNCIRNYTLTGTDLELKIGEVKNVNVSVTPTPTNDKIIYTSADGSIAKVDKDGNVTGISEGETTIKGVLDETGAEITINVKVNLPNYNLTINGPEKLFVGKTEEYNAIPNPTLTNTVTSNISWTSNNKNIATIDSNTGKVTGIKPGLVEITAILTVNDKEVATATKEITVYKFTANDVTVEIGKSDNVNATVDGIDNPTFTYNVEDDTIATVNSDGTVTGHKEGITTIYVTNNETDDVIEVTVTITLPDYELTIEGKNKVSVGNTENLTSVITPALTDATTNEITWASNDSEIATVDPATGKVTTVKPGTVEITATLIVNGKKVATATKEITVYEFTANDVTVEIGETSNPEAIINGIDNPTFTYEIEDNTVVSVDKDGNLTGIKEGETTVKITNTETGDIIEIIVKVELPDYKINIDGKDKIYVGDSEILTYTINPNFADTVNKNIIWTSSDETVAIVDDNGNVTAIKDGEATITARLEVNDAYDTHEITVSPYDVIVKNENIELYISESENIDYTITPDIEKEIIWYSDNETVAVVDEKGKVTATGEGTTTITGVIPNIGITITVVVTVKDYTLTINGENTMFVSKEQTLVATPDPELADGLNDTIEWKSSDDNIVFVDANGKVTAIKEGSVTITATLKATGASDTFDITVIDYTLTADDIELDVGETEKVEITINPEPTNNTITWESKDPTIATVDKDGNVTGVNPGTTTIIGTLKETGTKIEITVTITTPNYVIDITGTDTTYIGKSEQLTSTITPELHSTVDNTIIWTSSDTSVATVDNNGNVKALKKGTVTITAKLKVNGASDTHTITVLDYTLVGNGPFDMIMGETNKAKVTITPNPTDNTVMWTSSNSNIVEINPLTGDFKAVGAGTATLTATLTLTGATATVTVNIKTPDYNITAPDEVTVYVDKTKNLGVTVTPNYKAPKVTYTSADTSIATVDANGNIKGITVGTTTITAQLPNGKLKTVTVNVELDPNNKQSIVFGKTDGIGYYHVSTDGGKTYQTVFGNSTIEVVKGSQVIIKAMGTENSYNFYINGKSVEQTAKNTITITVSEYILIGATSIDVPDVEESLNWFQKLIKAIKEFFQKLFGIK